MIDKKVIIYDDFYDNPLEIRNIALNSHYESDSDIIKNYPGLNTYEPFWTQELQAKISSILGEGIYPTPTSSCGQFRYTRAKDKSKQIIHFDPKPGQVWAGLIYLSLPEHYTCNGRVLNSGTKIYSHKATGMDRAPINLEESKVIGVNSYQDMINFFETEGIDESKWNVELNIPIKFNRAVFFRCWLWHGMGQHFGTDIFNSRLTHLIFLNKI